MKTLANLTPSKGSNTKKRRVGRGIGSGLGKTSGLGHKGQKARKSSDVPAGFEGGQVPLYRRLPKRGFKNRWRTDFEVVNVGDLVKFPAGAAINNTTLHKAGLIRHAESKVKLLGEGKVAAALTVSVSKASATAKAAIEKAGGKLDVLDVKAAPVKKGKKADASDKKKSK